MVKPHDTKYMINRKTDIQAVEYMSKDIDEMNDIFEQLYEEGFYKSLYKVSEKVSERGMTCKIEVTGGYKIPLEPVRFQNMNKLGCLLPKAGEGDKVNKIKVAREYLNNKMYAHFGVENDG